MPKQQNGDLYFQIDDDKSSLKFSNFNLFRNSGNTVKNSNSLVVEIRGKNSEHLLLIVTELEQQSQITLSDVHVNKNTAGTQAYVSIIFVHSSNPKKNDDPSQQPILFLIENSEIIQNTLAPISESSAIQLEGLKPQQILIKNSTINNRSPPNNNKAYELMITIPQDCEFKDLITQFQVVKFGITLYPVTAKVPPSEQFDYLTILLSYKHANIQVSTNGQELHTKYVANYYNDVRTLSCAMIIIRAQDTLGLLKGIPRSVSITGSFTENDLRIDDLTLSFRETNFQTQANMISFKPNLQISNDPIDSSLFCIHDGGLVTLSNLFIQRSIQIGSENAPIALIISRVGKQSNELQNNAAGQLVIERSETCNVGQRAIIVADEQTIIQISGSTIRTFEGPAVRALNGVYITIDKNTILNNNRLKNRNKLSSMQNNVVCEGGIGTITADIALDNVTSYKSI
ncbi:MAG: hypothetical protein EZS28_022322 [Streblomastix strix]|uniref:Uncharacterized protein n=1 Tax=Streblomastix strix TaxID=222440 RepID=A0A5J4VHW3_9EUKA|nr:MAG: hypothetical protein EZS28_022322 [Streblomastix strix]